MSEKVAVVTGGAGALGRAVVDGLLRSGWRVHVTGRADLTDAASVEAFFGDVDAKPGRLGLLCNLVGGFAMGSAVDTDPATWNRMLATNATVEGQTTAHYITERLKGLGLSTSRLAHGVPVGGELDYLDEGTLTAAMRARRPFS